MYILISNPHLDMKNSTFKGFNFILVFALICSSFIQGQSLLREVSLSKKINASNLLVEGKVIEKQSFWDADKKHIYTSNTIEIYKIFKGNSNGDIIEIITKGGTVGLNAERVHPSLQLTNEIVGLFFIKNNNTITGQLSKGNSTYIPTVGAQSFYAYDLIAGTASGSFQKYDNLETTLYNDIHSITDTKYKELKKLDIKKKLGSTKVQSQISRAITSISPTSISAGTKSVLTINGSGFGANKGSVKFRSANDGGETFYPALESQIISWSDDKIEVQVPGEAGTGRIRVLSSVDGITFTSSSQLIIPYAETSINTDLIGSTAAYQAQHVNSNSNGGYIWQMHTDFYANDAAKEAFIRAMNTWRCATNVYWELGEVTDVDVEALDQTNIIRFDNGEELPDDTVGRCTSYYTGCIINNGTEIAWYVDELDIVFDEFNATNTNGTNWQYGPATPLERQSDFESVAVHELGHGHQLGHVNNKNDLMYHAITEGDWKRDLNDNNTRAANDIQSRSTDFTNCGQSGISAFDCSELALSADNSLLAENILLFPTYATDEVFIQNSGLLLPREINIIDIRGRLAQKVELNNNSLQKINIKELSSGLYFVQIKTEKGILNKKLLVE